MTNVGGANPEIMCCRMQPTLESGRSIGATCGTTPPRALRLLLAPQGSVRLMVPSSTSLMRLASVQQPIDLPFWAVRESGQH
jgi:hypothetical protein